MVRRVLVRGLSADPELDVVGSAEDPYEAEELIERLRPDVITLDVEMPRMDGLEFLRRTMPKNPMRVVMVSALTGAGQETSLRALELGAIDVVGKPEGGPDALLAGVVAIREKVKIAARANVAHWRGRTAPEPPAFSPSLEASMASRLIAIGASTGGVEATKRVLAGLSRRSSPIVVVQHMPADFLGAYAARLDEQFPQTCLEARDGALLEAGSLFVAPGGVQTRIERTGTGYKLRVGGIQRCSGHVPSVDTLFNSVAEHAGPNAAGVLLTGMGRDGAAGLLAMRRAGAFTVAQDQDTSTVYGMPKVAALEGAVDRGTALFSIPVVLNAWMTRQRLAS